MSELLIQQGLQAVFQSLSEFASGDVVINDWDILDQSAVAAPYVIISNAHDFVARQDTKSADTVWQVNVTLFELFTDFEDTYNNFRARRQAIIDKMNEEGDARSAGQAQGVDIMEIRNDSQIEPYYDPLIPDDELINALPIFIFQRWIFEVQEF